MNQRSNDILYDIVNGNFNTINNYAKKFKVSTRTIRNDIKEINMELLDRNHQNLIINEQGKIKFDSGKIIDFEIVMSIFKEHDYYTYHLSPEERKTILAMILMNSNEFVTVSKLSDLLLVSRNTILNDLDELKLWFSENNLKLESYTRKGFLVKGLESDIRKGMMQLFVINSDITIINDETQSILSKFLLQEIDKNCAIDYIFKIIKEVEKEYEVIFTNFSYRKVAYSVLVNINRILSGNIIEDQSSEYSNIIMKSSKYDTAKGLMDKLSKKFKFEITKSELENTVDILRCQSYIKNSGKKIDMIDIQILINEFIYKVSKSLNINYYLDFYLYDLLIMHLKATVNRAKQGKSIENPLVDQVKSIYPYVCNVIKENIVILEEYLNCNFSEHEISFIAMYIISIMEKNNAKDTNVKVVISCATGQGTAQLLATRLQTFCKQVEIYDIVSPHALDDLDIDEYDLIISTIGLKKQEKLWIKVNPLLPPDDIYELQKIIVQIQDQKLKDLKSYKEIKKVVNARESNIEKIRNKENLFKTDTKFIDLLSKDRVMSDVEVTDWRDAVRKSGKLLCKSNLTTSYYTEAMIKNIEKNGSYIVIYPGVAIPHAEPDDGALVVGASLIRLKEPIKFNHKINDPVKYVIAFSIKDSDSIGRPMYNLIKMLGTGSFIDDLDRAKDESDIIQIVNNYEKLIIDKK